MNNKIGKDAVTRVAPANLLIFGFVLLIAGGLLGRAIFSSGAAKSPPDATQANLDQPPKVVPPWGELVSADILLEAPEEYLGYDLQNVRPPEWRFLGMSPEQVRALMTASGLSADQITRATSSTQLVFVASNTLVHPDEELVLSLSPEVRRKFYLELGRLPGNDLMKYPFIYPGRTGEGCLRHNRLRRDVTSMIKKLLYTRGDNQCLSDLNTLMLHIPEQADRMRLLKTLSRQPAVEATLRIRPGTDVDKLVAYWGKGAKAKDIRPLLESLARMPEGSSISLLHLLPSFARERLDTFPAPPKPGDPNMDCHWTSLNFFNETPDHRLGDPTTAVAYIQENYYPVPEPTNYGDVICFVDDKGHAIHSAVYLAADLVFTKNGNNFAQPWKIARLKPLQTYYELDTPTHVLVWRKKSV